MAYQFGWLIQKLNMEEKGINSYFIPSHLMSIWNHIETHNKSGNKYIFQYNEIITVSRAARTVCGYIIINSKIIIPQKMTNTF